MERHRKSPPQGSWGGSGWGGRSITSWANKEKEQEKKKKKERKGKASFFPARRQPEGTGNPKRAGWAELPRTCANSSSIPGQTPDSVLVCRVAGGGCRGRKGRGASRGYYTDRSQTEKGKSHMIPCVLSHFSHVQLYATLGTIARQAPLSMGILQAGVLSGLPCPPPGDFPNSGNEPESPTTPALQADLQILYHWATGKGPDINYMWDLKIVQMNDYTKQKQQAHRLRK